MTYQLSQIELEALLETAAAAGAKKALHEIGLHDEAAGQDVQELRGLLEAWRNTKRESWKTAVQWLTKGFLLVLLAGVAVKLGVSDALFNKGN